MAKNTSIILRRGKAPDFYYEDATGMRIKAPAILEYVKSLVIPPKYENVKIYLRVAGSRVCEPVKLTYTGVDPAGRTQYGYSAAWKARAGRTKFRDLIAFGGVLPKIRLTVASLLKSPQASLAPTMDTAIAMVIRIVNMCHFRLGNEKYKSLYKSYGVSTIETRHLKFGTNRAGRPAVKISFVGKKGVKNDCAIDAPDIVAHLANMVRDKQPREPVFTYGDDRAPIRAADVNAWMRRFGVDITSKMFRTYATNVMLIEQLKTKPAPESLSVAERKRNINTALDEISGAVHNTRAVCKGQYAHPDLIEMYLNHPRMYKSRFMGTIDPEPAFLAYLRAQL